MGGGACRDVYVNWTNDVVATAACKVTAKFTQEDASRVCMCCVCVRVCACICVCIAWRNVLSSPGMLPTRMAPLQTYGRILRHSAREQRNAFMALFVKGAPDLLVWES